MTIASNEAVDQAQIVKLIEHWAGAIRARDVDARLSNYSKNVSLFDVIGPLQSLGFAAVRQRAEEWFSTFDGPLGYEMHDLRIATHGDVAFSHSLNHVSGTRRDGEKLDMWWRATVCYRKLSDQWQVAHEHNSVPFHPGTGKASLDLQPLFSAAENGVAGE
jgi:ketosteroid isomerase-like protein